MSSALNHEPVLSSITHVSTQPSTNPCEDFHRRSASGKRSIAALYVYATRRGGKRLCTYTRARTRNVSTSAARKNKNRMMKTGASSRKILDGKLSAIRFARAREETRRFSGWCVRSQRFYIPEPVKSRVSPGYLHRDGLRHLGYSFECRQAAPV